ncbi:MAG: hypothetical protein KDC26_09605 [Armatimonadetes bacterium]|nr:hypothetical protein [Armatimonadota bacterium]
MYTGQSGVKVASPSKILNMFDPAGLLIGSIVGFGVFWLVDATMFRRPVSGAVDESRIKELEADVARLRENLGQVKELDARLNTLDGKLGGLSSLEARITALESRPVAVASVASVVETPEVHEGKADDLTSLPGLTPAHAELLSSAGITSFAELAATPRDRILEICNAQPWDNLDVDAWISHVGGSVVAPVTPVAESISDVDFSVIEGINAEQSRMLVESGITSFSALASADESTIRAAVKEQPWDVLNIYTWQIEAKAKS